MISLIAAESPRVGPIDANRAWPYAPGMDDRYAENAVGSHAGRTLRSIQITHAHEIQENFGTERPKATIQAQLAVDGKAGKYRKFKGNVATVYSKPHCHGGSSSGHYGGNAETYNYDDYKERSENRFSIHSER